MASNAVNPVVAIHDHAKGHLEGLMEQGDRDVEKVVELAEQVGWAWLLDAFERAKGRVRDAKTAKAPEPKVAKALKNAEEKEE